MDKLGQGNSLSNVSSSSRDHLDPTLGLVLECSSSTELMCDFHTLGDLLWSRMITSTVTHECQHFEDKAKVSSPFAFPPRGECVGRSADIGWLTCLFVEPKTAIERRF